MNAPKTGIAAAHATAVASRFTLTGAIDRVEPYGDGLINDTFLVSSGGSSYILQRINGSVFPEPEKIMSNLALLGQHLASQADTGLRIPALIRARDGLPFVRDWDGGIWRLIDYIPNSRVLARIENLIQAREVGRILGRFHMLVGELPPNRLAVTLPGFHETPGYLERFTEILASLTAAPEAAVTQAVAFVEARRAGAGVLEQARKKGQVPVRIIHGDPKLDNILFDRVTGRAVSLIDLDTVQPSLVHYDVADCLRSCCNRLGEAAGGVEDRAFDLNLCRAILAAYADETRGLLSRAEIGLLPNAIQLIPFELGLRFLIDHLEGNRYFRVSEPGQNLRKAKIQFALVEDIEAKDREIRDIVADCFGPGETTASAKLVS